MRRNQEQQAWNLNIFIRLLAIPAVLIVLTYLCRNSAEKKEESKEDGKAITDVTCLRFPKISQICCESGYQRIDDLVACLKGCDSVRFYHNTRQGHVSNMNAEVRDKACLLTCLERSSDGEFTEAMIADIDDINLFARFCYQRS